MGIPSTGRTRHPRRSNHPVTTSLAVCLAIASNGTADTPFLHPDRDHRESYLEWFAEPGVLYTVEMASGNGGWQTGPHVIGAGETLHYYLAENFETIADSALVRLNAYVDPGGDPDGDGLDTLYEVTVSRTSPLAADSDGDGKFDAYEDAAGTDPNAPQATTLKEPSHDTKLLLHRPA